MKCRTSPEAIHDFLSQADWEKLGPYFYKIQVNLQQQQKYKEKYMVWVMQYKIMATLYL